MPKEIVHGEGVPYGTPDEPGPARTIVEVGWQPGSHVELVTRIVRADDGSVYEPRPGEPGDWDIAPGAPPRAFGVFVQLDRSGINQLIRHLRRARDHSFGKDE
jgi:hypothetical protein